MKQPNETRIPLYPGLTALAWFLAELAARREKNRIKSRRCYERLKQDPQRYARRRQLMKEAAYLAKWSAKRHFHQ